VCFDADNQILEEHWLESTGTLTNETFKLEMQQTIGLLLQYKPKGILLNTVKFCLR
jgi:hypothetical protein